MSEDVKRREIKLHERLKDEYGKRYGSQFARIYQTHWNGEIIDFMESVESAAVLDCGCGNGVLLEDMKKRFPASFGMDISHEMLKSSRLFLEGKHILSTGDTEALPFRDETFDFVVCRGSLHHVPVPEKGLKEIWRVLKKGGSLIISEPCADSLLLRLPRKLFIKKSDRFEDSHRSFTSRELFHMLRGAGFSIQKKKKFGFLAFPLCGMSDILPIMKFLPFNKVITRLLIFVDKALASIPLVNNESWHIIIKSLKV